GGVGEEVGLVVERGRGGCGAALLPVAGEAEEHAGVAAAEAREVPELAPAGLAEAGLEAAGEGEVGLAVVGVGGVDGAAAVGERAGGPDAVPLAGEHEALGAVEAEDLVGDGALDGELADGADVELAGEGELELAGEELGAAVEGVAGPGVLEFEAAVAAGEAAEDPELDLVVQGRAADVEAGAAELEAALEVVVDVLGRVVGVEGRVVAELDVADDVEPEPGLGRGDEEPAVVASGGGGRGGGRFLRGGGGREQGGGDQAGAG